MIEARACCPVDKEAYCRSLVGPINGKGKSSVGHTLQTPFQGQNKAFDPLSHWASERSVSESFRVRVKNASCNVQAGQGYCLNKGKLKHTKLPTASSGRCQFPPPHHFSEHLEIDRKL